MIKKSSEMIMKPLSPDRLLELYETIAPLHFPAAELKTPDNIRHLLSRNGYEGLGFYKKNCEDSLLGYALFITVPEMDVVLLDYYAVLEEYRCLGMGSQFLNDMKEYYKDKLGILLETEDAAEAAAPGEKLLRLRRNSFYCRNGAMPTGIRSAVAGVPYEVYFLSTSQALEDVLPVHPDLLRRKLKAIYHFMLHGEKNITYERDVQWR